MKFYKLLSIVLPFVYLVGCSHQSGGIASSTSPLNPDSYYSLGEVEGHDCTYHLFGIIPLSDGNETKDALNEALNMLPNTKALTQVTSDTYSQYWILWSNTCTQVFGTAVTTK